MKVWVLVERTTDDDGVYIEVIGVFLRESIAQSSMNDCVKSAARRERWIGEFTYSVKESEVTK